LINRKKPSKFIGELNNNKKNGFGLQIWENGTSLVGVYNNDYIEGYGKLTSNNKIFCGNNKYFYHR
jgi:hypothetical protein